MTEIVNWLELKPIEVMCQADEVARHICRRVRTATKKYMFIDSDLTEYRFKNVEVEGEDPSVSSKHMVRTLESALFYGAFDGQEVGLYFNAGFTELAMFMLDTTHPTKLEAEIDIDINIMDHGNTQYEHFMEMASVVAKVFQGEILRVKAGRNK